MKNRARYLTYYASEPRLFVTEGPWPYYALMVTPILWLIVFLLMAW